jgi:Tfp pilus assembly protein PilV
MKKKKNTHNSGFTLVETLVAISIFTFSILGLLSVLTQGITNTYYAKQKMIAVYLAQEGIEYIRNVRDTYVLYDAAGTQTGWTAFNNKVAACTGADGCYFEDRSDYTNHSQSVWKNNLSITACSNSDCTSGALLYDSATGKYGFSGANSGFVRKIKVTTVSANETKLSSTVNWKQGSGSYSITFSESLFNWVE